ncbi:hypothetical protein RHSIM_Rhsim05G0066300 [Rhododendron simsii]|uniref:mitogen-activated protein kinase kinase kinase n=1 Tax=Rhododendron simsii TaxID=118357 RepID=A0A834H1W0_RHOSS|nr:hypothetical protein RHSIM_Rhsim05G0066300 [Rhododendron simsii]
MQLQVHQYSDPTIGMSGRGSTSGNSPKDVLSTGESVNKMGEVEDEESLNEVTVSSDPRELEELNCYPLEVPPTISHHFYILNVLDLSYTEINSLPQSISRLVALQKLILRSCELLMELPPEIGELTNLEVLDLEGTEILCLPKEIAKLVNLTCLKVSFYGYANQTVIPRRVLSNLSRLIELIIDVTPYGGWWDVEQEAIVDDLCSLKELRTLQLYSPTAEPLEELTLIFPGLANFRFTVGRHEEHFISRLPHDVEEEFNNWEKLGKGLKYLNGNRISNGVTKVLKHANAFFLQRHWTVKSLSEFGHKNMSGMKFCLVMECNEFQTLVDSQQFKQGKDGRGEFEDFEYFDKAIVLGSLERLIIRYMKNIESFWNGPVGKGSLSNLKSLALHTCPNLTTLFTIDMVGNLINLEELIVEDCPKIDSVVSLKSPGSKLGLFLPSLKKISLLELPELVGISSGLCIAPNLERMVIFYCPKLEKLSTMDVSSTNLKVIKGEREWWDALKWYESDLSTEHEDYLAGLFIPLRRDGDLMAQLKNECSPLKNGLNRDEIQARVRNIDEVGRDYHEYRVRNVDEIRHDYNESGVGGCGIKGDRPPLLAPPPGIARRVIDNVSSTWDILKSFGPQGDEELCSTDGLGVTTSVMTKEEDRGIEKDNEGGDDEIVGKLDMGKALVRDDSFGSESYSDTSNNGTDEASFSVTTGDSFNCISPNREFKRSIKSWKKGELLGRGFFGTVYEAIADGGFFFAVKEVSLLDQGSQGNQSIFQLEQEISLLSQFQHENIVQYFGTDKDDSKLYIFQELVSKGSLANLYQKYRLRDSQVSEYTRQILNGLNYLHCRNVVHRDIKCANILVDANGSVKLADFGLTKATNLNDIKSCKGNPFWMAPEVVKKNQGTGLAADIWSLGCTVLEMLTRKIPYSDLVSVQALFRIGRGIPPLIPSSLSVDAQDFIFKCLQVIPADRPTAAQLLDHPFVKRTVKFGAPISGTVMAQGLESLTGLWSLYDEHTLLTHKSPISHIENNEDNYVLAVKSRDEPVGGGEGKEDSISKGVQLSFLQENNEDNYVLAIKSRDEPVGVGEGKEDSISKVLSLFRDQ